MKIKIFIILIMLCFSLSCFHLLYASNDKKKVERVESASSMASFFPLSEGNRWRYRCSVEGKFQFEKEIKIVSVVIQKEVRLHKVESRISTDEKPFVYYLFNEKKKVFRTFDLNITERELVITVNPKLGDRLDQELKISRHDWVTTPATGKIEALIVENFNPEQSANASNEILDWRGFFYARGIGCVAEADGLGGECVLIDYHVNKTWGCPGNIKVKSWGRLEKLRP